MTFFNLNSDSEIDPDFLWEISKKGIIIWGRPETLFSEAVKHNLNPRLLCKYSLKEIKASAKRAVIRKLYESKYPLIRDEEKLAPGIVLISADREDALVNLFLKYGISKYSLKKVWI